MGFADGAAGAGLGLRGLGSRVGWSHGRIPVEEPSATVAGEQFTLAQLVPCLRTNAHAATGALLIFNAGNAGSAGAGEAVVADQAFRLDERPQGIAFAVEDGQFGGVFLLAECHAGAGLVEGRGKGFNLGSGCGKSGFLGLSALQAGDFFVFKAIGFRRDKADFVLDGFSLRGSGDGVELDFEACSLLAVSRNLALQPRAQRFLAVERIGGLGGLALGVGQRGFSLDNFDGQGAYGQREAGALQIHCLQLYEVFNVCLHPCQEVYGIYRLLRKWGPANPATMEAEREAGLADMQASFWRRNRWIKWVAGGLLAVVALLAVLVSALLHRAEPYLRARIIETLHDHFHARVELDSFHMSLANGLWAEGKGLRIWPPAQVEGVTVPGPAVAATTSSDEPLIRLEEFRFHAPLYYRPGQPFHISLVELKGMDVHLPPRSHFGHGAVESAVQAHTGAPLLRFAVDTIECSGAHLVLETSKQGKLPLDFAIAHLKLTHVSNGGAMGFDADLTNPRPVGTIHTTGSFGPWLVADPGESPVAGDYRFDHADLAGFKGIAGILSSTGHYQGTLRDLVVDGETDTPDFRLTHFGNALPLHTRFHARVDGTNGDTWLEPVEATLEHSHFTAQGQIVRVLDADAGGPPHSIGHDIDLAVNVDRGRIEDFLRLASRSDAPLLTGAVNVKTRLHIPPGSPPVHERLSLNGSFTLNQARFSSAKIQDRIEELSLRGLGRPRDMKSADSSSIQSTMQGDFQMAGGVIALPSLTYTVPGAEIDLKGTYGMEGGALNFTGAAKLQATVSAMVGGWKGLLLKPVDHYFKKDGAGTEVPIHIDGTRENPKFGIDFNRMKGSSAEQR